ncbi:FMN-binding glutamate synthase family protein [Paramagnetospirillum kuznetsovii]|uniref:FMN-binding glutamate synthase family protein n=1 Tax=Paramagnetospirillum kuznetsovii TaxID=2053833 RepID=A0A364P1J2_9PROT|nr:FMN-binding glutamate synthase family protein [Paramagnetospirillum kuznetsovii]RAU23194.1 FMN-binding glutamate synthase family protein [Paramagnetospirillum kuznetsovii]
MGSFVDLVQAANSMFMAVAILAIGAILAVVAVVYVIDITQTQHAVRRNYPVIGRFRYFFEYLGEFFRQYFFAQDREEMPFNRAQRAWVYRAAKNLDSTVAFGSTRVLRVPGELIFVNAAFPTLDEEAVAPRLVEIGGSACRKPYFQDSLFNISAMSFGALSVPAVRALSMGAAKAGCWLNTGEGGLSPHHLEGNCDIIYQIGTAKYGIRDLEGSLDEGKMHELSELECIRMFEIKLAQGAKPGKGGILPGSKVTAEIAAIRGIPVGQDSISPNRHPEIDSADGLLDMIDYVRVVTGKPTGFKTVFGDFDWFDDLCERIHKRGVASAPDFITIDSADGGTGAAPQSLIDYVGLPIQESLPHVVDLLVKWGLKDRVRVIASGKLVNPAEVAWALCMGADFVNSARGFMFALGCIQAMQCNKNTCPTGVTTHDPKLQRGLDPFNKADRVAHYVKNMEKEVCTIAHSCGVPEPRALTRRHCRMVQSDGRSMSMADVFPLPTPIR